MALINTLELCRILAGQGNQPLTKPRITQLEKEGMPRAGRDQWDAVQCMYWYLGTLRRHVRSRMSENQDGSSSSVEQERKRLLRFQGDRAEVEAAKARGEAMSVSDHERIIADFGQEVAVRVRAVGPRIAGDLTNEPSRTMIQAKLEKAHDEALVSIAAVVPRLAYQPPPPTQQIPTPTPPPPKKSAKKAAPKKAPRKKPTKEP